MQICYLTSEARLVHGDDPRQAWKVQEERCWLEFFNDPSQWWDNRVTKLRRKSPHFKHVKSGKGLWIDSLYCPNWVHQKLKLLKPVDGFQNTRACYSNQTVSPDSSAHYSEVPAKRAEDRATPLTNLLHELKTCSRSRDLERVKQLHTDAIQAGFFSNIYVYSSLINLYGRCGCMSEARKVFDSLLQRNVVSWNSLILGYVENGESELALEIFAGMEHASGGCSPDARTYVAAITACSSLAVRRDRRLGEWLEKGKAIHARAITSRNTNIFVENALINLYAACGEMSEARKVFDNMTRRDVVSWNALLQGYVDAGKSELCLELFDAMQEASGCVPDSRTYVAALGACADLGARKSHGNLKMKAMQRNKWLEAGKRLHSKAVASSNCTGYVQSTLVNMYGSCGSMELAREVFHNMTERDVVSWNCLVQGYVEAGENELAVELVAGMDLDGISPNPATFAAVFLACANLMAVRTGQAFHEEIVSCGMDKDVFVATCLVDFYGKCGEMKAAEEVFRSIAVKDVCTWNALLGGYSNQGKASEIFRLFKGMREQGICPDEITFTLVLTACSHAGLTDRGREFFYSMKSEYGITPDIMHYACMVDLLGRANYLEEALSMVRRMPFEADAVIWCTLLGACQVWKNVEVGKVAYDRLVELDGEDSAAYVLMGSIYRGVGMEEHAEVLETKRCQFGDKKKSLSGQTWWSDNNGRKVNGFEVTADVLAKLQAYDSANCFNKRD